MFPSLDCRLEGIPQDNESFAVSVSCTCVCCHSTQQIPVALCCKCGTHCTPPPREALPLRSGLIPAQNRATCQTRSSAQGNCNAKSLVGSVANSSLPSLSSVGVGGSGGWGFGGRGLGRGKGVEGEGQGTFHPPCHILHYHMVLRPEGTSYNKLITWERLGSGQKHALAPGVRAATCKTAVCAVPASRGGSRGARDPGAGVGP